MIPRAQSFLSANALLLGVIALLSGCGGTPLETWHSVRLKHEFVAADAVDTFGFDDYLQNEARLFAALDEKVYAVTPTGSEYALARYSAGSAADPRKYPTNWNRSFEQRPTNSLGAVLLLHGMSDSPYSLRALGLRLAGLGYHVIGLRLPGHGTVPSGLRWVRPADMTAAVTLSVSHLASENAGLPVHIIGYSTGATLALNYALDVQANGTGPMPASLVLVSPAVRIHGAAAAARTKDRIGNVTGMRGLNWLSIVPEFDPFKYNSFATNAGDVVHRLTRDVDSRLSSLQAAGKLAGLPPVLVFKSSVDATVTTEAVVDNLLGRLEPAKNELVLFDVNRYEAKRTLMYEGAGYLTDRLLGEAALPFAVRLVTNAHPDSLDVVVRYRPGGADAWEESEIVGQWPPYVYSLSHVALPFPPEDPVYGATEPEDDRYLFLGNLATLGEREVYRIPAEWRVRMRYNPFYFLLESRVEQWLQATSGSH